MIANLRNSYYQETNKVAASLPIRLQLAPAIAGLAFFLLLPVMARLIFQRIWTCYADNT